MRGGVSRGVWIASVAQLQASEHDKFAARLYRSRREYRSACECPGKASVDLRNATLLASPTTLILLFKRGLSRSNLIFLGGASDD